MKAIHQTITQSTTLAPAVRTATANGTSVDLADSNGNALMIQVGTITDGVHTPSLQESSDNATWNNVAAADQIGTFAALASNVNQKVGYIGKKRYIRAVITIAGATTGGVYNAFVIESGIRKQPA